jgi:hypothetical protein
MHDSNSGTPFVGLRDRGMSLRDRGMSLRDHSR